TGQTMVSSATVKTEYTASASIEENSNFTDNNSSHPSENPFTENIFSSTSNKPYIPSIFINTPSNLNTTNNDYESLTDDSNDTIDSPTTNTTKGKTDTQIPDLLKIYNPSTCFNKFLSFYNLQLLPTPQSIGSFLKFIQDDYPAYYSEQYINISIKISNNNIYEEAHIHLPQETILLPNFSYIPFKNLLDFQNIPLKTNRSSTKFKIPSLLRCQNSLLPTPHPSPELPLTTTHTNNNILSSENLNITQSIKIHSLNVNGLLDNFKQLSLIDFISENQIDIFGISETHLSNKEAKFSSLSQKLSNYKCFWTSANARQSG